MNSIKLYFYHLVCIFLPLTRCYNFKASMLRWCGAKVGKNVEISSTAKIYGQMQLSIGNNCFIGHDALICGSAGSKIIIEDFAKVGTKAILVTGSHEYDPDGDCIAGKGIHADIKICKGASVGTRTIILPGKTVNRMAHVAAGSIVTHDVPEYCRVAGIPARVIKNWKTETRE